MLRASPLRGIAPSRYGVGSSACQALFLRSPAHHRPHVSISWALPQALASCGILPNTPCGWHLLTTTRESTCRVPPFPVPMAHIRRAVLSTGFLGRADRSVSRAAGAVSCAFGLQRVSLLRWGEVTMAPHTFACAALRCVLDGIPGVRLPGSAVYPRSRPLRTSRRPGGYAVTPAPGGVGIELRRAQLASTFPQAPLRSRTVGFPEYGSDPGFPLQVFLNTRKLKRWLAYTPLLSRLPSGSSAKAGSSDARR